MSGAAFLDLAVIIALGILCLAFAVAVWRTVAGPTLPDRIIALDTLVVIAIGFIATIGIQTSFALYVDIAIALGLVGFIASAAFARFLLSSQGRAQKREDDLEAEE